MLAQGFFVNNLPLQSTLSAEKNAFELFAEVSQQLTEMRQCEGLPFDQIKALSSNHQPMFQAAFNYRHFGAGMSMQLGQLKVTPGEILPAEIPFELVFDAVNQGKGKALIVNISYGEQLFEAEFIQQLGETYCGLLEQLCTRSEQSLGSLSLLNQKKAEQWQALSQQTLTDYQWHDSLLFTDLVRRQAIEQPTAIALVHQDQRLSYAELESRSNALANLLIRDFAASKDDSKFPYLRNFDPANGFSWASGNANFTAGNNNESTSEAANAYGAIALYGMITGNDALIEKGMYLHASSTSAYWEYWNNIDRFRNESSEYPDRGNDYDNFPADYNRITTSIIWGNGSSFSTWFSGAFAHILGIQGLPLNPLVLHVGQYPDYMEEYVALGLTESSNGKPSGLADDNWRDIWWNLWAMTDADASFADYQSMGSNYNPETGESKAHTYHWVKTWQELGHLKTGAGELTANHPAAVAFYNNGKTTYIAYNFGANAITVIYSDGQQLNVAANSFEVVTVGESGDDDGGTGTGGSGDSNVEGNLLTNGTFENGIEGWNGGTVVAEGDNNVFSAEVANPGNPWDVNLSQSMTIIPDATYELPVTVDANYLKLVPA